MSGTDLLYAAARDLRYAMRLLRKTPAFTITASLTLALAVGINAAVFAIVDAVLLKPLPYPQPDRLGIVTTSLRTTEGVHTDTSQTGATWMMVRDGATRFDRAVYSGWPTGVNVVASGRASYVQQQRIGAGFFRVLGVVPIVGREFTADEDRTGGPAVVILGNTVWRTLFNADPSVIGTRLIVRGEAATIVGIMPAGFHTGTAADIWTPLRPTTTGEGEGENYAIVARVRRGVEWSEADTELQQIGADIARQHQLPRGSSVSFSLQSLQSGLSASLQTPLLMLWSAVGIALLIACTNLAGLFMARTSARAKEIATRMALGSSRGAQIRQLVVESLLLGAIGWVGGIALGALALVALKTLAVDAFDIWQPISLDGRTIAMTAALAFGASVVFGAAPAIPATRIDLQAALSSGGSRAVAGRAHSWPRRILIVSQVALGAILLVAASLLVRTYSHLQHLDAGLDARGVMTVSVSLQDARYRTSARVVELFDDTLSRVSQTPGVDAAGVALGLPYERLLNLGFRHVDGPQAGSPPQMTSAAYVAGEFFRALRIPISAGRYFEPRDRADAPGVAIVNEAFVRQYFVGANAIGRRIALAGREREIVGVVGDVQVRPGWGDYGPLAAMPLAYIPAAQATDGFLRLVHGWFSPTFVVRTSGRVDGVASLRRAVDGFDPLLPFARVRRLDAVQRASLAPQRFLMALVATLAVAAILLAAIGIHGLIATTVVERTREMGIRLALGATVTHAMRDLAVPGVLLALAGTVIGAGASLGFARLLRHLLWGVTATDPITFAAVSAILLLTASIASFGPALRVLRLDPAETLRQ